MNGMDVPHELISKVLHELELARFLQVTFTPTQDAVLRSEFFTHARAGRFDDAELLLRRKESESADLSSESREEISALRSYLFAAKNTLAAGNTLRTEIKTVVTKNSTENIISFAELEPLK